MENGGDIEKIQNGRNGRGRVGKGVESAIGWGRVETGGW